MNSRDGVGCQSDILSSVLKINLDFSGNNHQIEYRSIDNYKLYLGILNQLMSSYAFYRRTPKHLQLRLLPSNEAQ